MHDQGRSRRSLRDRVPWPRVRARTEPEGWVSASIIRSSLIVVFQLRMVMLWSGGLNPVNSAMDGTFREAQRVGPPAGVEVVDAGPLSCGSRPSITPELGLLAWWLRLARGRPGTMKCIAPRRWRDAQGMHDRPAYDHVADHTNATSST